MIFKVGQVFDLFRGPIKLRSPISILNASERYKYANHVPGTIVEITNIDNHEQIVLKLSYKGGKIRTLHFHMDQLYYDTSIGVATLNVVQTAKNMLSLENKGKKWYEKAILFFSKKAK